LRKKGAHFIRKKRQLKKIIVDFRGLNVWNTQNDFWFASNFEHWNLQVMESIPKKYWEFKLLCFPCDFSKIYVYI
jgi:hypothetical protein